MLKRYARLVTHVHAIKFTPEIGKRVMANDAELLKLGITYVEGRGYQYRGHSLRFGDFVVASPGVRPVWAAKDFHAQFTTKEKT